jgi:hypothetical protein
MAWNRLAADEPRAGIHNKPATGDKCPAGLRLTGAGRARSVPRRRSCSIATYRRYRVTIPGTKGALYWAEAPSEA